MYEVRDDKSNISRILDEAATRQPRPEVVALGKRADAVIDALGVEAPAHNTGTAVVATPLLYSSTVKSQRFDYWLRRVTSTGTSAEQFTMIELLARGIDGTDIQCATLENNRLRVDFSGESARYDENSDISLFSQIVDAGERAIRQAKLEAENKREERLAMTRRGFIRASVGAGVLAAGYGLWQVPWGEIFMSKADRFDRSRLTLQGGAVLRLGGTVTPDFSAELANDIQLAADQVPYLTNIFRGKYSSPDDNLNIGDGLRQIEIPDGMHRDWFWEAEKPWRYEVSLQTMPVGTSFLVWTDLRTASGQSRAQELQLSYEQNRLVYEWHGRKIGDEKARIVVQIQQ